MLSHRIQALPTARHVMPCILIAISTLGSPASVSAESFAQPFGFSTMLGSNNRNEEARAVALDTERGRMCAVGQTAGTFETIDRTTDGTTVNPGSLGTAGAMDIWLTCWYTDGNRIFSTVFGGPGYDAGYAITINASGIYVAGRAGPGLTTSVSALQPNFGGDLTPSPFFGPQDGFIAKYSWDGEPQWLSYLGDPSASYVNDIVTDPAGAVYVALADVTADNPHVTAGAFLTLRPGGGDAVIAKLQSTGQLIWATYLGGSGVDLHAPALAIDDQFRNVFIVGSGNSTDFPITANASQSSYGGGPSDLTLTSLNTAGTNLLFSTYFGGSGAEISNGHNIVFEPSGDRVAISGDTTSADITTIGVPSQASLAGDTDMVLAVFTRNGARTATTYLGGSSDDSNAGLAMYENRLVVAGSTTSADVPQHHNDWRGAGLDGYVAVMDLELSSVTSAARMGGSDADAFTAVAANHDGYAVVGWSASAGLRYDNEAVPEQSTGRDRRDAWVILNKYMPDQPMNGGADAPLGCNDLGNCGGYDPNPTGCVSCASTGTGRPTAGSLLLFGCTAMLLHRSRRRYRAARLPS